MSIRNLEHLFRPQSAAVIGASETPHSVGATVLHNLVEGKFAGSILPVNPKYRDLAGIKVYPSVTSLPTVPELAVICTPPATVPTLIGEPGACGTKAAIVITAGLGMIKDAQGRSLSETKSRAVTPPNSMRVTVPAVPRAWLRRSTLPGWNATAALGRHQRYFLSLLLDQLRKASSVFSTCLVGFKLIYWKTTVPLGAIT